MKSLKQYYDLKTAILSNDFYTFKVIFDDLKLEGGFTSRFLNYCEGTIESAIELKFNKIVLHFFQNIEKNSINYHILDILTYCAKTNNIEVLDIIIANEDLTEKTNSLYKPFYEAARFGIFEFMKKLSTVKGSSFINGEFFILREIADRGCLDTLKVFINIKEVQNIIKYESTELSSLISNIGDAAKIGASEFKNELFIFLINTEFKIKKQNPSYVINLVPLYKELIKSRNVEGFYQLTKVISLKEYDNSNANVDSWKLNLILEAFNFQEYELVEFIVKETDCLEELKLEHFDIYKEVILKNKMKNF